MSEVEPWYHLVLSSIALCDGGLLITDITVLPVGVYLYKYFLPEDSRIDACPPLADPLKRLYLYLNTFEN